MSVLKPLSKNTLVLDTQFISAHEPRGMMVDLGVNLIRYRLLCDSPVGIILRDYLH